MRRQRERWKRWQNIHFRQSKCKLQRRRPNNCNHMENPPGFYGTVSLTKWCQRMLTGQIWGSKTWSRQQYVWTAAAANLFGAKHVYCMSPCLCNKFIFDGVIMSLIKYWFHIAPFEMFPSPNISHGDDSEHWLWLQLSVHLVQSSSA